MFPNTHKIAVAALTACLAATPALADEMPTYKIEMKDGAITPLSLEVPAGKPFKLEIVNSGKTAVEFESAELKKEKVVKPGSTGSVSFKKLAPGSYSFIDEFHPGSPKGSLEAK
jgi:plastocyanin